MKKDINQYCLDQGPIRPPNEYRSLLIRITRNCPWNKCMFCRTYKKRTFSLRTVQEIKDDIQAARYIADDIKDLSVRLGSGGKVDQQVVNHVFGFPEYSYSYRSVAQWLYHDTGACFFQDADNLVMKTDDLVEVLRFLRDTFPEISRITTYSRSRTVSRKSPESLKLIKLAGLDRLHMGLESGSDAVLQLMNKGVTSDLHIEAGIKAKESGLEVSEYVMPGLGGQEMWKDHALETARVLNSINPDFIRLRSLRVLPVIPLYQLMKDGQFILQSDDMVIEEIKLLVESLSGITSMITSDHVSNLLEDVNGKLPQDKTSILNVIKEYQDLSEKERLIFRIGRRGGVYKSVKDMIGDSQMYEKIESLLNDVFNREGFNGIERFITDLGDRAI